MHLLLNLRVAVKNKLGYIISIFSLVIGFSVCLIVFRYYVSETSYDTNHPGYERIYRTTIYVNQNGSGYGEAVVQFPVSEQLEIEYPGIEATSRITRGNTSPLIRAGERKFVEDKALFADSNFFSFFDFPLVKGDRLSALAQPNSVVLSKRAADKYFGEEDPMGKTMIFEESHSLVVTGIVDETKVRSHIKFDVLIPMAFEFNLWKTAGISKQMNESWLMTLAWTYVKFKDQPSKDLVESQLDPFVKKFFPDAIKSICTLHLQPLTDIHTHSNFSSEIEPNTSDIYLRIFLVVIGAILLFSTINFVNLNTSILLNRRKEFAVKGILGASKGRLFGEIFASTLGVTSMSLVVAIVMATIIHRPFNDFMAVDAFEISFSRDWPLLVMSFAFVIVISILASIQPFFTLSDGSLAGNMHQKQRRTAAIRKLSLSVQIACSFILTFGTLVIFKQTGFLMKFNLGFDKEHMIVIPARPSLMDHSEALKEEVKKIVGVKNMTWTTDVPGLGGVTSRRFVPEGFQLANPLILPLTQVDYDFIETMNIKMIEGREFDPSLPDDVGQTYIVNKALLDNLGWKGESIGKKIQMYKAGETVIGFSGKIIGVFDDFHMESLHFPVQPLIIALPHVKGHDGAFIIKTAGINSQMLKDIEIVWKKFENDWPFEYTLLNDKLTKLYQSEDKLFSLMTILSLLAITISFFGLFGMNSIAITKQYKTVSIKKVLGAHSGNIVSEIMRGQLVFLAIVLVVAAPCGYFAAANWLNEFQYSVRISFMEYLQAVTLITVLIFATLTYHLVKVIRANPLEHIARD